MASRVPNLQRNINLHRLSLARRVNRGIKAVGQRILEESDVLIPVDTHAARETAGMRVEPFMGPFNKVIVGYGGQNEVFFRYSQKEGKFVSRRPADYIVIIHEDHTLFHAEQGRMAGFLRFPARNFTANLAVLNREVMKP